MFVSAATGLARNGSAANERTARAKKSISGGGCGGDSCPLVIGCSFSGRKKEEGCFETKLREPIRKFNGLVNALNHHYFEHSIATSARSRSSSILGAKIRGYEPL